MEERHLCRKSRLWYFLEVSRHNFVQSSKGQVWQGCQAQKWVTVSGSPTAEPLGSFVLISILRLLQIHIAPLLVPLTWNSWLRLYLQAYSRDYFFPFVINKWLVRDACETGNTLFLFKLSPTYFIIHGWFLTETIVTMMVITQWLSDPIILLYLWVDVLL